MLVQLEMDTNCVVGEQVVTTLYGEVGGVSYVSAAVPIVRERMSS